MLKTKLPVIVLRNMILLPSGELKLEVSDVEDKEIIKKSCNMHDSYVLLISPTNIYEENLKLEDLPKIGTIGKITSNFELPNSNMRITITGVNRAQIFEYVEEKELNAVIGPVKIIKNDEEIEEAILRRLKSEFISYISMMPNISNGLINRITDESHLEKLSDVVANILPLKFELKLKYLNELNSVTRAEELIKDIQKEKSIGSIDKELDEKLKIDLDKANRDYILREKIRVIKEELKEDTTKEDEISEIKNKISNLKCSDHIKEKLYKELNKYEYIPATSPEVSIVKSYLDTMLSLPFETYTKDNNDLNNIEKVLNSTHFGLDEVKTRILEYIAVNKLTDLNKSPIICLVGPPGVGKTSLAYSVAKALKRNFVKISVGGVSDEAEIIGHRRTYIGAKEGRIIGGLRKAKSSNPVFLIDEIDKMTKDIKGDPASSLLEVLDPNQNKEFCDNYIEEAYDLSNVMFILTANDISLIPYPLLDRLEIIELPSYTELEKLNIVKNYMYPNLLKEHGLTKNNLSIDDETLKYIINSYTKEAGVRNLQRTLSKIMRKVAMDIVKTNKRKKHNITISNVIDYLGTPKYSLVQNNESTIKGIVNGLAYTSLGGTILPIEVTYYKGKGNIILTGLLGEVMSESAKIALGYVKSNAELFNIDSKLFEENDIHINAFEGSIKKDGPSAGVTLTTAIISAFKGSIVPNTVAMTGEISLTGKVLPIGGLREKLVGAINASIKKVFIPKENERDINEIDEEIKSKLQIIYVSDYKEIYDELMKKEF